MTRSSILLMSLLLGALGCRKQSVDISENKIEPEPNQVAKEELQSQGLNMEFLLDPKKQEYLVDALGRIKSADTLSEEDREKLISEVFDFYSNNNLGGLNSDELKQEFHSLDQAGKLLFLELQLAIYAEASGCMGEIRTFYMTL